MRQLVTSIFSRKQGEPIAAEDQTDDPNHANTQTSADVETETTLHRQSLDTLELIEGDLVRVSSNFAKSGSSLADITHKLSSQIKANSAESDRLNEAVTSARDTVEEMASTTEQLSSATDVINQRISTASEVTQSAVLTADQARAGVNELERAIESISGIVEMISDIAKQTNLLALNATIEAARAGELGKGFAVVSSEVKGLSDQTQRATEQIAEGIASLKASASVSSQSVDEIVGKIKDLSPTFDAVQAAVAEQAQCVGQLNINSDSIQDSMSSVEMCTHTFASAVSKNLETFSEIDQVTGAINADLQAVGPRFVMLIRQTRLGDRRQHDRLPVAFSGSAKVQGTNVNIETVDVSKGGMLLATPKEAVPLQIGERFSVSLTQIGNVHLIVRNISELGIHCQICDADQTLLGNYYAVIERLEMENQAAIELAQATAASIAFRIESSISEGKLAESDVFDTDYNPIEETAPQQFSTKYLEQFEQLVPAVIEDAVKRLPNCVFCIPIDVNGYIPIHNAVYSQPQRPGEVAWNTANSRNKRIFDDRAGLSAGRNTRPYLIQVYPRDMGGGKIVWLKEIDAPININDRHWGGVRVAMKL